MAGRKENSTKGQQNDVAPLAIELRGISKAFGHVQANKNINLSVSKGTIHGIIGENGAGKSTLMSILYGFYRADSGQIFINGNAVQIDDSQGAIRAGICMVFQHFKLVRNFTVLESVILGAENGLTLRNSLRQARRELLRLGQEYGLEVDLDANIGDLSVGHQQRVEILKALYRRADILILDEPTGVLTPREADHLFRVLNSLKEQGKTIVLITHKLREIMMMTDQVSVMRRGEMVASRETAQTSPEELAELMVGRQVLLNLVKTPAQPAQVVLKVDGLSMHDTQGVARLKNISFELRAGEVLGIAGVAGNGQSELMQILGGMLSAQQGSIWLNGAPLPLVGPGSDAQSRRCLGVSHVPEDRHHHGLVLEFPAWENIALGYHNAPIYQKNRWLMNHNAMQEETAQKMARFDVRPPIVGLAAHYFSGGNQQKIILAREIECAPDLLLIGQPTRGVDIGAIEFIHNEIIALRDRGAAILLVSVELDEIRALSDRVAVMFDGEIMGICDPTRSSEAELGMLMAGIAPTKGESDAL